MSAIRFQMVHGLNRQKITSVEAGALRSQERFSRNASINGFRPPSRAPFLTLAKSLNNNNIRRDRKRLQFLDLNSAAFLCSRMLS